MTDPAVHSRSVPGPGPWNVETAERINVGGTRNVLELIEELDIPKGVYTSGLGVYSGINDEKYDESYVPDRPTFAVYVRTLWEAHYEVAKPMMEDGLPLVIVLLGTVYGPIERPLQEGRLRGAFQNYLTSELPIIPRGFTMPFEYAEDTAHNHIRAMTDGVPGEEYIIANEPRTMVEVFDLAEEITGIPARRAVPPAVFGGIAKVMAVTERVVTPPEGPASELLALQAGRNFAVDNTKAKRELGIELRPLEEGLCEYLLWEMDHLGLDVPEELPAAQAGYLHLPDGRSPKTSRRWATSLAGCAMHETTPGWTELATPPPQQLRDAGDAFIRYFGGEEYIPAYDDGYHTLDEAANHTDEQQTLDIRSEATDDTEATSDGPSAES